MSDMEHNKGRLIPTGIDLELYDEDSRDDIEDNGLVIIDGEVYSVEWEIRRGELYGFERADVNSDGSIDFETYHYNGGAHWTELIEDALKNK